MDRDMKVICNYTGITKETSIGDAPIVTGAFATSSLVAIFLAASNKLLFSNRVLYGCSRVGPLYHISYK